MSPPDAATPRQDEILDRTFELLREAGMAGLTMKKVAERVGFTEPAIYRHFPNKQALLLGVAERLGGMLLGPVREIAARQDLSPLERIELIVAHHIGIVVDTEGIPILLLAESMASAEPELGGKMAGFAGAYLQVIGELARELPSPPDAPPMSARVLPVLGVAAAVALQQRFLAAQAMSRDEAIALARYVVRRVLGEGDAA